LSSSLYRILNLFKKYLKHTNKKPVILRHFFKIFNNKTIVNTILNYHVINFLNVLELKLKSLINYDKCLFGYSNSCTSD